MLFIVLFYLNVLFTCPYIFLCLFILKVEKFLGNIGRPGDTDEMHRMENEITVNWDGLPTKELEHMIMINPFNFPVH